MPGYSDPELYHYGVKGMKWGVRRSKRELIKAGVDKKTAKKQSAFEKKVQSQSSWTKSYSRATDLFNKDIVEINKRYEDVNLFKDSHSKRAQSYIKEVDRTWRKHYSDTLISDFGEEPINKGRDWVNDAPFMNTYLEFLD